jgi:hypothetical protein
MIERVKLRNQVVKEETVNRVVKEALYANRCAGCDRILVMNSYCNDNRLGELMGTFHISDHLSHVFDGHGKSMGNMFSCFVCSFACADAVMKGKWREIDHYKPFADADCNLVRAELKITTLLQFEAELLQGWDTSGEKTGGLLRRSQNEILEAHIEELEQKITDVLDIVDDCDPRAIRNILEQANQRAEENRGTADSPPRR